MALIGVSGKKGSGKDTIAEIIDKLILLDNLNNKEYPIITPTILKFASPLKEIVSILTGCTLEELESHSYKERKIEELGMSPRELLEYIAMNFRENISQDIWVNLLAKKIIRPDKNNYIISDVRLPNEVDFIKRKGGILIRVTRDFDFINFDEAKGNVGNVYAILEDEQVLLHTLEDINDCCNLGTKFGILKTHRNTIPETALDNYDEWDYHIVNNYTLESLTKKVRSILIKEKII